MDFPEILRHSYPGGDPAEPFAIARRAEAAGDLGLAATAIDRAYGCAPRNRTIAAFRRRILDRLSIVEHGIVFRYVPAGMFIRGSETREPDERPEFPVRIEHPFWLSETTVSWSTFHRLMGWPRPPVVEASTRVGRFVLDLWGEEARNSIDFATRVRLQYCEDRTTAAHGWHAHDPTLRHHRYRRVVPLRPSYKDKPMVAVSCLEAETLAALLTTNRVLYSLPTESQWEKAARGGLIGCRYPWGDEPPTPRRCDFGRFEPFAINPSRRYPPNGYGLYGMCGSVWEWTSDSYHRRWTNRHGRPRLRVLRGGSWTDPADVVTVSFRMSRDPRDCIAPNIGFRLCRQERRKPRPDRSLWRRGRSVSLRALVRKLARKARSSR